jgi:hypothetical protein
MLLNELHQRSYQSNPRQQDLPLKPTQMNMLQGKIEAEVLAVVRLRKLPTKHHRGAVQPLISCGGRHLSNSMSGI